MEIQTSTNRILQERLRWPAHSFNEAPYLISSHKTPFPAYKSDLGALFAADCMKVLPSIKSAVVDTVFADPPFNLGKKYGKSTDDLLKEEAYLYWCKDWLAECVRVIKPGGLSFYIICRSGMFYWGTIFLNWVWSFGIGLRWRSVHPCLSRADSIQATTACSISQRESRRRSEESERRLKLAVTAKERSRITVAIVMQ